MGIGGAFIMPATLSIITNVFTDPRERGQAIGVWAGVAALGVGIGPVAGGVLLTHFYWGSVFFVNLPIVVVALIAGWFLVPDSRDPSAPRLDPLGAVLSIVGLATLLWAIIEGPAHGWTSTPVVATFLVGVVVLGLFVVWELHSPSPMLDMRFFENPRFTAASLAIMLVFLALFGSLFLLTQYLQSVHGFSPLKAGALVVPQAVVVMIAAPLSSARVRRFGNKVVVAIGMTVAAVGTAGYALFGVHSSVWLVIGVTMFIGLGMGNVMAPATDSIMGSLPRAKAGVGSAMNDTTRQTGGAIGVAVIGSVMASRYHSAVAGSRALAGLPASLAPHVRSDIGSALLAARSPQAGRYTAAILSVARASFVSAFHLASLIAAGIVLCAAIGVAIWLPARETRSAPAGGEVADPETESALAFEG